MSNDGMGRPRDVTCEEVLKAFDEVGKPVANAPLLADELGVGKQSVLRRLQELEDDAQVERWQVGGRAVVWWPMDDS
jgi:predicted ArsR family transcriptional regulator